MKRSSSTMRWIAGSAMALAFAGLAILNQPDPSMPVPKHITKPMAQPTLDRTASPSNERSGVRNGRLYLAQHDRRPLTLPNAEKRIVASLLNINGRMRYGTFVWNEIGVAEGPVWIRVDLHGQTLSVFRGEHEIGAGVVLFGADSHPTPLGKFPVLAKFQDHASSIYDAKMPYTLRLTEDGVSVHGSNVRRGLATHGCIGIPTAFAAKIFSVIKVADPVYIVNPDTKS
jgi:lipoprotein-anchoring transpeptidase ErfK/SrfK